MKAARSLARVFLPTALALLVACAGPRTVEVTEPTEPTVTVPASAAAPGAPTQAGTVLGRNERVLVYMPKAGDTWSGLATRFLGDASQAWRLVEANREASREVGGRHGAREGPRDIGRDRAPQLGVPVVVPLVATHPLGVGPDGARGVVILCYHRLGSGTSRMSITPQRFETQLDWLQANGYTVVKLDDVAAFMAGRKELPDKAVVITFDDGYESVWRHAFPMLRKRGMPATLFVYTDFVGAGDALDWNQMGEMQRSGLVDIQAHSKSHRNLAERLPGESEASYRARLDTELTAPRMVIERALGPAARVRHLAYPYGDANEAVLDAMRRNGYELGLTVLPGPVRFYAAPLMLGRVMIYGDLDLDEFKARVQGKRGAGRS